MTLIIGFGSRARQGKDTAATAIKNYYESRVHYHPGQRPLKIEIFKYATALYREVNEWLKVTTQNGRVQYDSLGCYIVPPDETNNNTLVSIPGWVQPDLNPEVSALAPYGKHPKLLQWWGTEYRRAQDPDYWVNKLFSSIPKDLDIALITDVRFPNEAGGIEERQGYLVNVQRLLVDGTQYFADDRPKDHPSETALDEYPWDFYLKTVTNHVALMGEQAITLAEYLRGLKK
jgi:hypothetical protein